MTESVNAIPEGAEPVLLLHCSASSGRQWEGLARSLDGRHGVIAPDLYGYGQSGPWPGPGPLSLAAEAVHVMNAIPQTTQKVHIVGHSYGGAVALRLAIEQPWRVRSLTLIEPVLFHILREGTARDRRLHGSVHRVAASVIEGVLSGDYQGAMARFTDYWNGDGAWNRTDADTRGRFSRHAPKVVMDFHAIMNEETPLDRYRAMLTAPVRVLRGGRSPEPARRVAELLSERIDGARLDTVGGAGHMLPMSHPEETLAVVRDQLESVSAGARRAA